MNYIVIRKCSAYEVWSKNNNTIIFNLADFINHISIKKIILLKHMLLRYVDVCSHFKCFNYF